MFYASCLASFKAYLSPTSLVESCKVYLLSTGFLDWTACLYQSEQNTPETETCSKNLVPEYQPQDEIHPPPPAARPDPVNSAYFRTPLYTPLAPFEIVAFEEYEGVLAGLGQRVVGIVFWADFGKKIGRGCVTLQPTMPAKSIPPEAWSLVQRHLDTARSLIPAGEQCYLKEKYGFDVENSLVLSLEWI